MGGEEPGRAIAGGGDRQDSSSGEVNLNSFFFVKLKTKTKLVY